MRRHTCNGGYRISGSNSASSAATCLGWGGDCSNGALITQSSRTGDNHCGSCNSGYYLSSTSCAAWGGSCTNGALFSSQSSRSCASQCASCNDGYYVSGTNSATSAAG